VRKHASVFAVLALVLAVVPIGAQAPAVSQADLAAIHQIREEGFGASTSKVMEIISYLSDVHGPRLTNSPNIKEAAKWTTETMNEWKLANVHLEPWGTPFGRGWSNERTNVQVIAPHPFPLIAYAKAWTPGTDGPITADAVFAPITKEEDFAKFKGQLKGKFVLTAAIPESPERFDPQAHRYTDAELADLATQPVPAVQVGQEDRIAQFRATHDLWAGDPAFVALLRRLRDGCPEFDAWWERHDVRRGSSGVKTLHHPEKGVISFEHASFQANDDPGLKLVIYTPVAADPVTGV